MCTCSLTIRKPIPSPQTLTWTTKAKRSTPAPITPVPADVQLILPKGQDVQLAAVEEGTSATVKSSGPETKLLSASLSGSAEDDTADAGVVTTRHETVANLLRRSHVKVADDEMVVVDLTADTPSITVCRQYTRLQQRAGADRLCRGAVADPLMAKGTEEIITPVCPAL